MNTQRSFFFNVDWVTVFIYLALCTIGLLNIHSAVYDIRHPNIFDMDTNFGKQFIYVLSAIVIGIVLLLLESRFLSALAPAFYGITVFMLILVLVAMLAATRPGYHWAEGSGYSHPSLQNLPPA